MDLSDLLTSSTNVDGSLNHSLIKQKLNIIKESFEKNETTLENFILGLGTALTSTNLNERTKGIELLSAFIELQASGSLNTLEVDYLCEFLVSRLKDHHTFIPIVIKTLLHLSRTFQITDKQALNIFTSIHREVASQQLPIQERFLIYQLIGKLFTTHMEAFKSINNDFVYGFMQIIEGECDPRCLILCFDLFSKVISNLSLGHLDEEIFDSVSCYFPISYNPTKEKGIHITRDDLHNALKNCFKASPAFAPYAYALFIEKLESDVESAKIDSYDMIISCASIYGAEAISSYLMSIWTAIRLDILRMIQSKVTDKATEAMISILWTIRSNEELTKKFLKDVFDDMEAALTKVDLGLIKPSAQFLATVCACSNSFMKQIVDYVFPLFMKNLIFDQSNGKREFLQGFTYFFCSLANSKPDPLLHRVPDQEALLMHLISMLDTDENHLKLSSLNCLLAFVQCPLTWQLREEEALARGLLFIVLNETHSDDRVKLKSKEVLQEFSKNHPKTTRSVITSDLFDKLLEICDWTQNDLERLLRILEALQHCLEGLELSSQEIHKLTKIGSHLFYESFIETDTLRKLRKTITGCLILLINEKNQETFDELFLKPLFIHASRSTPIQINTQLSDLIAPILHSASSSRLTSIFENFLNSLKDNKNKNANTIACNNLFKVIEFILCNTSLDFQFSWNNFTQEILSYLQLPCSDQYLETIAVSIEIVLNKSPSESLESLASHLKTTCEQLLSNSSTINLSVQILVSANRALVIRGQDFFNFFTPSLLALIENHQEESVVSIAAKNFVPCHLDYPYYKPSNSSNISPFYGQKYFYETFQPLLKGYNNSSGWKKSSFALCLLSHLRSLPKTIIRDEINKLQSLVIFNLEETDAPDNQITALDCLAQLIETNSPVLTRNISGIINRLLVLCKQSSNLNIRKKSLECLTLMAKSQNEITLLPYRPSVLLVLKMVLDDRKRIVRYACCSATHSWTSIGQPT